MKTGFVFLASTIFVTSAAFASLPGAGPRPPVRESRPHFFEGTAPAPTPKAAPIVRDAKIQIQISKYWREKQADGTFAAKNEEICRTSGMVPVYLFENGDGGIQPDEKYQLTCKTNLKVGPSLVKLTGFVILGPNAQDPFETSKRTDFKVFGGYFTIATEAGDFVKMGSANVSAVEDLNLKRMLFSLTNSDLTSNKDGDLKLDETIAAQVRIED